MKLPNHSSKQLTAYTSETLPVTKLLSFFTFIVFNTMYLIPFNTMMIICK